MLRRSFLLAAAVSVLVTGVTEAQSRSIFGSNSMNGSNMGTGTSLRGGSQQSGRTQRGSSALSDTGLGTNMATGLNIAGAPDIQLSGETGFVGRSDAAGDFIGSMRDGQQGGSRGLGTQRTLRTGTNRQPAGTNRQFNAAGQTNLMGNFGNTGNFNAFGQNGMARRTGVLRPQQRISFQYPARPAPVIVQTITNRFQNLQSTPELRAINIVPANDGTIVLRGRVPSQDARNLAAAMARLEPGVRAVVNELEVAP